MAGLYSTASHCTMAQEKVPIHEQVQSMSPGNKTGFTLMLTHIHEKEPVKVFRTWIADLQKKADVEETAKYELLVKGFAGQDFGGNPVQVYYLFEKAKESITVIGFFKQSGTFISGTTTPDSVEKYHQVTTRFNHCIEKVKIKETLAAANTELEKRNDEQTALEKKQKQLNNDIADCAYRIQNATSGLYQKTKKEEIGNQKTSVKEIEKRLKKYEDY